MIAIVYIPAPDPSLVWATLAWAAGGMVLWVVALWLILIGLRRRITDGHPRCRLCGFDLTGKPETTTRCGECGADLNAPKAVRVEHHQRRGVWLAIGIVIAVIAAWPTRIVVNAVQRGIQWDTIKPLSWLMEDAVDSDPVIRLRATYVIESRIQRNALSKAQLKTLADRATAVQIDRSLPWESEWGSWYSYAYERHLVSDAEWAAFQTRAAVDRWSFTVRPRVAMGEALPYTLQGVGDRGASWHSRRAAMEALMRPRDSGDWTGVLPDPLPTTMPVDRFSVDGRDLPAVASTPFPKTLNLDSGRWVQQVDLAPLALSPGPHVVRVRGQRAISIDLGNKVIVPMIDFDESASFELLPAGTPTVTVHDDMASTTAVRKAFRFKGRIEVAGEMSTIALQFDSTSQPPGLGYDVLLRAGGKEWPIGQFAMVKGSIPRRLQSVFRARIPRGLSRVDLVFRSSVSAAAATTDVMDITSDVRVFKDIDVAYPPDIPNAAPRHGRR